MINLCNTYNISPVTGFSPENTYVLTEEFYYVLEGHVNSDNISSYRDNIKKHFDITDDKANQLVNFRSMNEAFAIYSLLSFVITRFVWLDYCDPIQILPKYLGYIYLSVCNYIGIATAVTHAAINLHNWKLLDPNREDKYSLDNLDVKYTTLQNSNNLNNQVYIDTEKWFYLVHIGFELNSGQSVIKVMDIILNNKNMTDDQIINNLKDIKDSIDKTIAIVSRIAEKCNNKIFFEKLRNFLSGWNKLPQGHLKAWNGDYYEHLEYKGGSAAQSSLIQVWDILLGVEHIEHAREFLMEMRNYMPYSHKCLLEFLINANFNLHNYIVRKKNPRLIQVFNNCVDSLIELRSIHKGIIHRYIINFAPELRDNKSKSEQVAKTINGTYGSGGTNPIPFMNTIIRATEKQILKFNEFSLYYLFWFYLLTCFLVYVVYYFMY